jgi:hypothetical protein
MAAQEDSSYTTNQRIATLEGELRALRQQTGAIFSETIQATKIFQGMIVLVGVAAGIFTFWQADQVDKTIQKAEQRIALIVDEYTPKSARVRSSKGDNRLVYELYLTKSEAFGRDGFLLVAESKSARIAIEGEISGRISGAITSWAGDYLEEAKKVLPEETHRLEDLSLGSYKPITSSSLDALFLPPESPIVYTTSLSLFFENCEKARLFSRVAAEKEYNLVTRVTPVLITSAQKPPSAEFRSKFIDRTKEVDCTAKS